MKLVVNPKWNDCIVNDSRYTVDGSIGCWTGVQTGFNHKLTVCVMAEQSHVCQSNWANCLDGEHVIPCKMCWKQSLSEERKKQERKKERKKERKEGRKEIKKNKTKKHY